LDLVVALALQAAAKRSGKPVGKRQVDSLSTCEKLKQLEQLLASELSSEPELWSSLTGWFTTAASLRQVRNSFVHGRWGTALVEGELCFVPAGVPGGNGEEATAETRYTLPDLLLEVQAMESLAGQLVGLRNKHRF
jgi:hypothetical protein